MKLRIILSFTVILEFYRLEIMVEFSVLKQPPLFPLLSKEGMKGEVIIQTYKPIKIETLMKLCESYNFLFDDFIDFFKYY